MLHDGAMRRRHDRFAVVTVACAATLAAGAAVMPRAQATAEWFNGVQSPKITLSSGATKVVHMGVLGYGATSTVPLDTGARSPNSITKAGSKLFKSPRLAYAVNRYADNSGRYQVAAVSWYLRRHTPDSHASDVQKAMDAIKSKDHGHYVRILEDYQWISSTSNKWAGPYTMAPEITLDGSTGGTIEGIGLKTRSDRWYAHKNITVTLHGPARFAGGGVKKSAKTTHEGLSWEWTRTGDGKVSATVAVTGLPPTTYRIYYPAADNRQRLMVPGPATSVSKTVRQPTRMYTGESPEPEAPSSPAQPESPATSEPSSPSPTSPTAPPSTTGPTLPPSTTDPSSPPASTGPAQPEPTSTAAPVAYAVHRPAASSAAGALALALNHAGSSNGRG